MSAVFASQHGRFLAVWLEKPRDLESIRRPDWYFGNAMLGRAHENAVALAELMGRSGPHVSVLHEAYAQAAQKLVEREEQAAKRRRRLAAGQTMLMPKVAELEEQGIHASRGRVDEDKYLRALAKYRAQKGEP